MKEYIERGALINATKKAIERNNSAKYAMIDNDFLDLIADAPTEDVVEVKHGEWSKDQEDVYWGNHLIKRYCSICGGRPYYDRIRDTFILTPYCPYCGAKMDGERKDEK